MLLTAFESEAASVPNINHAMSVSSVTDCAMKIQESYLCRVLSDSVMQSIITLINRIFGTPAYCYNAKSNLWLRWVEVQMQFVNEIDLKHMAKNLQTKWH